MKNNISKKTATLTIFLFAIIFSINSILAFGVLAPYWDEHPLEISSVGGETTIQFELQNMVGSENLTVKASVIQGSEIVSITDLISEYEVPLGSKVKVNLKIKIPEDAKIGQTYDIGLSFTTIQKSSSGAFGFGSAIEKHFPIKIIGEARPTPQPTPSPPVAEAPPIAEEKKPIDKNKIILLIAGLVIVVILIIITLKKKNRKRR